MAACVAIKEKMLKEAKPLATKVPSEQTVEVPAGKGEEAKTVTLQDEYSWLRGKKWPNETVDEQPIIDHLNKENTYCKDFLASLGDSQEKIFQTLKSRMKLADTTVEVRENGYLYYSRTFEDKQYSVDCRRPEGSSPQAEPDPLEEPILDRNALAAGKDFSKVLGSRVSTSHRLMAYKCDYVGSENYKLQLQWTKDSADGKCKKGDFLPESDKLSHVSGYCWHEPCTVGADGSLQFDNDADPVGLFYSIKNEFLRPTKVFYHRLGTDVSSDTLLFESKNDMFTVGVGRTSDRRFVMVSYSSSTENENFAIDLSTGALEFGPESLVSLRPLVDDIEYDADHGGGAWYLKTKEGCTREHFRVLRKIDGASEFTVLVEEHPEMSLKSGVELTKNRFALHYLSTKTGQPRLFQFPHSAGKEGTASPEKDGILLKFPGVDPEATSHDAAFSMATSYSEDRLVAAVDTPVTQTKWYEYDATYDGTGVPTLVKAKVAPNYDSELYATERLYVEYDEDQDLALHPSLKGVASSSQAEAARIAIPVTILYKKALLKKDGSMPLLLNGYGSYGICEEPVWSNLQTQYADLGFVVATAHIRGGGDLGEPWYQASKFLKKKRTFLDFIACADHLAKEKWTSSGNVAICGGSAGGMLVGACLNMRPELFRAVVAHVPFVTVLDTMLDDKLPLTPGEFKEWGNPREAGYFGYMQSYCPYENVRGIVERFRAQSTPDPATGRRRFPNIFSTAGLTDYRVGYYECAKWIARLRMEIQEGVSKYPEDFSEPLIIMETNMTAGHAGASGRFDRLKEVSRDVAFLATEFGLLQ